VEYRHHEAGAVVVPVDGDGVGLGQIVGAVEVDVRDVAARLGGEGNPVVEGVQGHGFVEEHIFVGVFGVIVEGVDLAGDLGMNVSAVR
jgi:hypothetical protein